MPFYARNNDGRVPPNRAESIALSPATSHAVGHVWETSAYSRGAARPLPMDCARAPCWVETTSPPMDLGPPHGFAIPIRSAVPIPDGVGEINRGKYY